MRRKERHLNAETELMQALPPVAEKMPASADCLHRKLLKSFLDGKVFDESVRNRILRHFDSCPACIQTLRELRDSRIRMRRGLLAVAAVVLAGVLIWFWPTQRSATETVIVDLHSSGVLRGVEEPPLTLSTSTKRLRIILAGEDLPGVYVVRLLKSQTDSDPVIESQGMAHLNKQHLELEVSFNVVGCSPGDYILGLRDSTSNWQYRPLRIER
jgi:hypothetical protein